MELIEHMLDIPLRTKKPTTFLVNSMSDLFHESLPDEAIDGVFTVMVAANWHPCQILAKRAKQMRDYFRGYHDGGAGPDRETHHLDQNIWPFQDPAAVQRSDEERKARFRKVRDQIYGRIMVFLGEGKS